MRKTALLTALCCAGALAAGSAHAASTQSSPRADCGKPGSVLDLKNWKLTLPTGDDEKPDEVKQPELGDFSVDPWFVSTAKCDGVRFRAAVNGVTTSGSSNPRSELREMNGGDEASWSTSDGTHTMTIDEAITHLPNDKPQVVAGQIHGADDDLTVLRLEGSKLYVTNDDDTHYQQIADDYQLGTRFTVKFTAADGKIVVSYNGKDVASVESDSDGNYFKAGAYTQANCDKSDPCAEDNYGEVEIYGLTVTHDG